ncbi:DUF2634 domain-containing protein [Peptococcus simiae]|uniref:DUF2634 domain-containing protein n=1 Tax=Peptococcus simiae TaxID=1643805 RepID=A0ABW9GXR2_9FIRM
MIPEMPDTWREAAGGYTEVLKPSLTWWMDAEALRIRGYAAEVQAVEQAVYTTLRTERYKHVIYSDSHGLEIADLIGQPRRLIYAALCRRIPEALLMDDRITGVDGFYLDEQASQGHDLAIGFTVHTKYGSLDGREVISGVGG